MVFNYPLSAPPFGERVFMKIFKDQKVFPEYEKLYNYLTENGVVTEEINQAYHQVHDKNAPTEKDREDFYRAVVKKADADMRDRLEGKTDQPAFTFDPWQPDPVENFVGRAEILKNIKKQLDDKGLAIICGMGGMGKSQTALQYAKNNEKYLYAPRGPVLNFNNKDEIELFLSNISNWMNEKGYSKLVINPYINFDTILNIPKKYNYVITKKNDYGSLHDSCKLAIMDIVLDENELISKIPSKFRQNTRRSYRKGLINKISNKIDFENFYKLYIETSVRHDFRPHDIDYFKKIYSEFKDKLIFLEVWYNDIPLAMSIDIIYKDKLIYLYGVSSTNNRNLLGMYNLQWEAIKYCINHNILKYDFGGVFCEEGDIQNKDYGLYNFKKGYCYNGFIDIVPDITFNFGGDKS